MAANSDSVLQYHAGSIPAYDAADLRLFQKVLGDIMEDCESAGSLSISEREYLKKRLAMAIFRSADTGERDYARLRQSAIAAVSAAPPG
jgi:hypothetical protein